MTYKIGNEIAITRDYSKPSFLTELFAGLLLGVLIVGTLQVLAILQ